MKTLSRLLITMLPVLSVSLCAQDNSRIAGQTYYEKVDTGWIAVHKDDFHYDADLKLIHVVGHERVGDAWYEKGITRFEYSGDSARLEIKSESGNSASIIRDKYLLDHDGIEVGVMFEDFDSSKQTWIAEVRGQYFLDVKRRVIEKRYLRNKEGQWMPEDRNLFEYDRHDRMIVDEFQMYEDDKWVTHQRAVNHYDKSGKLLFTEIFPQDKSNPAKLSRHPDTRIEMTYDPVAKTEVKLIKSWQDGKWVAEFKRVTYLTS